MAIFHCNISVASRGKGASAVAGAAYLSRSKLVDEREGKTYNYTNVHRYEKLVCDLGVAIPEYAPEKWKDRSVLWNDVERVEKKADAQLVRRFVIALPDELSDYTNIKLAKAIINSRVGDGHICDAAIHRNKNGTNTHLHILEPLRRCDENDFLQKCENVYTVRNPKTGEEKKCNGALFKNLKQRGFEKIYKYRKGSEWRQLTPTEAKRWDGCKRHSKAAIQETHYLNTCWNDKALAEKWRNSIAAFINAALRNAQIKARVDHRSYERRGIEKIPTRHLGPKTNAMELKERRKAKAEHTEYVPVFETTRKNEEIKEFNRALEHAKQVINDMYKTVCSGIGWARVQLSRKGVFGEMTRRPARQNRERAQSFAAVVVTARRRAEEERRAEAARQKARERNYEREEEQQYSSHRGVPSAGANTQGQSRGRSR